MVPFHCTVDPEVNPDPNTVILNAGPAAATEVGDTELTFAVQPARAPSRMAVGANKSDGGPRNDHRPHFAAHTCSADISIPYVTFLFPSRRGVTLVAAEAA